MAPPSWLTRLPARPLPRRTRRRLSPRTPPPMPTPLLRPRLKRRPSLTSNTSLSSPRRSSTLATRTCARPTRVAPPSSLRARPSLAMTTRTSLPDLEARTSALVSARRRRSLSLTETACSSLLPARTSVDAAVVAVAVARDAAVVAASSVAVVAERVAERAVADADPVVVPSLAPTSTTTTLSPAWVHSVSSYQWNLRDLRESCLLMVLTTVI